MVDRTKSGPSVCGCHERQHRCAPRSIVREALRRAHVNAMVGEHPTQTSLPGDHLKPAWRVACVAYRRANSISPAGLPLALPCRNCAQTWTNAPPASRRQPRSTMRRSSKRSGCGTALVIRSSGSRRAPPASLLSGTLLLRARTVLHGLVVRRGPLAVKAAIPLGARSVGQ